MALTFATRSLRLPASKRLVASCTGSQLVRKFVTPATTPYQPDTSDEIDTMSQFEVTPKNGFLPRREPLKKLPERFAKLEDLLNRMPVVLDNGKPGLLASGEFGAAVLKELPEYDVSDIKDTHLLSALYRDYTFAASAYLLEPCDLQVKKTPENFGLGRDRLPRQIAVPLVEVSKKLNAKPYMEYALSYALFNWAKKDDTKGLDYDNIKLIRKFHGGAAEHGFIVVHVAMVAHTPALVTNVLKSLDFLEKKDRTGVNKSLSDMLATMQTINVVMDTMWTRSDPKAYLELRTFIMGTKDQPMFPNGVIYEGVSDQPMVYRGESGANDSIIPSCDNLFELTSHMPKNPLTEILKDFRSYRPIPHNEYLNMVQTRATNKMRDFACADPQTALLYLANVDQVREFRQRHWNFTKEYIIKHTYHPVATGGSPIVTWLPNQLSTVLRVMEETAAHIDNNFGSAAFTGANAELFDTLKSRATAQRRVLEREVETLMEKFAKRPPKA
eukprot:Colp12_sorted_trinity150504_noHs@4129